eukprot:scaffold17909_cov61-Phaeocystis_antarctica.AAC.2
MLYPLKTRNVRSTASSTPSEQRTELTELKIVKQVHRWVYRLTSHCVGHQHWVCTSLGRSAPLPHPSYQD